MSPLLTVAVLLVGLALGALGVWLVTSSKIAAAREQGRAEAAPQLSAAEARAAAAEARGTAASEHLERLTAEAERRYAAAQAEQLRLQGLLTAADQERSRLAEALGQERKQNAEKVQLLTDTEQRLKVQFENLANQILEQKSAKFTQQNADNLKLLLGPLGERLGEFKKTVEEKYDKESKDRSALQEQVRILTELNQKISQEASNLTSALKGDNKVQGNWGELTLERLLEQAGLREGHEFQTQAQQFDTEVDKVRQPDVLIRMPEGRVLIIDAKITLTAYERYCNAATEAEREAAARAHCLAVEQHVKGLAAKHYQTLYDGKSPDFVLMFLPIEPAFILAGRTKPELFRLAYENKVMIVGPSTLQATLKTVATIWQYERQNRNVLKIAEEAGKLYDAFTAFVKELQSVGSAIDQAHKSYAGALERLASGRGNLIRRAEGLKSLGAKAQKALPGELVEKAHEPDHAALPLPEEDETQPA
jgi:DNA recombination protein RmuC